MPTAPVFNPKATTIPVLRYLVALADHRHFGKAAAACAVSQPTLSAQIGQWEKRMQVAVFERKGTGVHLTAAGGAIIAEARSLLAGLERLETAAIAQPPFFGPVRLGVIPTIGPYLLPLIVPAFERASPGLELPLREDQTGKLLEALDAGQLDCLILAEVPGMRAGHLVTPLYQEPFFVALPRAHRLAAHERIAAQDLACERVLLLAEGHCLRDQALEVCHLRGAGTGERSGADWRATSLETLRHLVALGQGCTVLPALAVNYGAAEVTAQLAVRPLSDRRASRSVVLMCRASDVRAEIYQRLAVLIRQAVPRAVVRTR